MEREEFQVGDCVRLSEFGRKNSRTPERRGYIVARAKKSPSQWQVLWSGLKMAQFVHWSHLERCEKETKDPDRPETKRIEDGTF